MKSIWIRLCVLIAFSLAAFAQSDRGTITGTITDPAGAVVPAAPIELKNSQTGATFQGASTETGNYTLPQIPTGTYELTVKVPGFKTYVRQNVTLGVAQTLRLDVPLEVGQSSESVTVSAEVTLLKTESGELSHNVASDRMNSLPVLGLGPNGAGSTGIRNPLASMQLIPGAVWQPNTNVRVNGAPTNTQAIRIEGQDSTNGLWTQTPAMTQPSVDAIQELSIQTSNYAAEFGQAGGGFLNVTMRSGTNKYHGTAYEYFVNEALNAGRPFTNNGNGGLLRPVERRSDYGFTLGGPVKLGKIYNGQDRTFFFFNFEQYREFLINNSAAITVPTLAYRNGDFSQALTGALLPGTDALGRTIAEGAVYDPRTERIVNGQRVRDPFPGNIVPTSLLDPVALKVQALIPQPGNSLLVNNLTPVFPGRRVVSIPAVKMDHNLSSKAKISGYWSRTTQSAPISAQYGQADGLPSPITQARGTFITADTYRLAFDYTVSPTVLLHLGAGMVYNRFDDHVENTNYKVAQEIGLKGTNVDRFPFFQNITNARGGMKNMGPLAQAYINNVKPTSNASLTWVKSNHTYKFGGEMVLEGFPTNIIGQSVGFFSFTENIGGANPNCGGCSPETGLSSLQGAATAGRTTGFPYASFLMGRVNNGSIGIPTTSRLGSQAWGFFAQDTWKVTRKLTLDYGLRYDYQTYLSEQYGRALNFSPTTPNPSAGNRLGAVIFEQTCKCKFANNYPYAFGPRLGVAYQIDSKTVLRAGFGVSYSKTAQNSFLSQQIGSNIPFAASSFGDPYTTLQQGIPFTPTWPNFDPGLFPQPRTDGYVAPPQAYDRNGGRPARTTQWSIGLQRELGRNFVVEASYVANRGAWWQANGLINVNALTPQMLSAAGIDINSAADRALLTSRLDSAASVARGFDKRLPYASFLTSNTVGQSLRPFPQFGTINYLWAPLGRTWYDSLQTKATKRFSHGLDFSAVFTYQKELVLGADNQDGNTIAVNDVFNRGINKYLSSFSKPVSFVFAGSYRVPKLNTNKWASMAIRDWQLSAVLQYGSGLPLRVPNSNNALASQLFRGTFYNRVPGQPLFLQDPNCHCFDPNTTPILNPAAWTDAAPGTFASSTAYYNDYRQARRYSESMGLSRLFQIREGMTFSIRGEFANIFNRTFLNTPDSTNPAAVITRAGGDNSNPNAQLISGFGRINTGTVFSPARSGTIVARFTF